MSQSQEAGRGSPTPADQVRSQLVNSLPRGWTFTPNDLNDGMKVLEKSLDQFINAGGDWEAVRVWVFELAKAITLLSVAMTDTLVKRGTLSRAAGEGSVPRSIDRHSFYLGAVLICGATHAIAEGEPCSNVTVKGFGAEPATKNDVARIRSHFREFFDSQDLP